jgi:hypothetical protein
MWSARSESLRSESLDGLHESTEKMMADPGYLAKLQSMNGPFTAPAEAGYSRIIVGHGEATSKYSGITRAAMTNGKFADATAFGVEAAEYIGTSVKCPSAFVKASYGGCGDVSWITGFDSVKQVDAFDDWQMSDPGHHAILERSRGLFVENSGHTSLIEKLN